ncbi:hypothetical protein [Nesterenkonia marinintestina]|uniref:hypothetical protein n=1 Tax=Nesterenkonia marinintestina TaxID=2979865 RepID=UPI0021BF41F8|nr:hypothetical protein [Nesterenkonia sp. GX14115]
MSDNSSGGPQSGQGGEHGQYGHGGQHDPHGQYGQYGEHGQYGQYDPHGHGGQYGHGGQPNVGDQGQYGYGPAGYGQQGYDHQSYDQNAYAAGGYGQPPGGGDGGPGGPAAEGSGSNRGMIIGVVVALVVVLGGIATAAILLVTGGDDDDDTGTATGTTGQNGDEDDEDDDSDGDGGDDGGDDDGGDDDGGGGDVEVDSPEAAVEAYLDALADSDADTASSLIDTYGSTELLTDEYLEYSNEEAPISDISVEEPSSEDEYTADVPVTFTVGEEEIDTEVTVTNYSDSWVLQQGAISVYSTSTGSMDTSVNGIDNGTDDIAVFWGTYVELDVLEDNYTYGEDAGTVVTDSLSQNLDAELALTEDAEEEWRGVIADEVEACLDSGEIEPGCGLDLPSEIDGESLEEGTVDRSIDSSSQQSIDTLDPELDFTNPNLVSTYVFVSVETVADFADGYTYSVHGDGTTLGTPVVDMTADELEVVWE